MRNRDFMADTKEVFDPALADANEYLIANEAELIGQAQELLQSRSISVDVSGKLAIYRLEKGGCSFAFEFEPASPLVALAWCRLSWQKRRRVRELLPFFAQCEVRLTKEI